MRWLALVWLLLCAAWSPPLLAQTSSTLTCPPRILSVHAQPTSGQGPPPANATAGDWTPVQLPDHWHTRWPDYDGAAWYRIDWQLDCVDPNTPIALALDSIVLAGEVWVNHDLLWRDQHLEEPLSRSWNLPRYALLPASALHTGTNQIWVRVHGIATQTPGLGQVRLGEPAALRAWYEELWWSLRTLTTVNLVTSALLGMLFLFAWLLRPSHTVYGWYAFNCGCWVLFTANVLATEAWPFPSSLAMARANFMLFVLFCFSFCIFTWRFGGQHFPRLERALRYLTGLAVAAAVLTPDALLQHHLPIVLVFVLIAALNTLQFPFHAWRTRSPAHIVYAVCLVAFMAAGIHDLYLINGWIPPQPPMSPYTAPITMLALSIMLGREVTRNIQRIERFNLELTETVNQACDDLSHTLEREHALALRHSRLQERLQITHDLHDSLGGSLVRSIAYVEQAHQPLANTQFLSMLKLMRDDLRQMIDNGTSPSVQVPTTPGEWAAPLRHRYIRLFDALGIESDWMIPALWGVYPSALQCLCLTRVVEEALTNVIKHSKARRVRVELLQPSPRALLLRVTDDGVGFDVPSTQNGSMGVGMRSMQTRLERVQGSLSVQSQRGATVLEARLSMAVSTAPTAPTAPAPALPRTPV